MVTGVFSENLILYRIPTSSPVSVHRSQSTELQRTGWLRAYKVHIAKVHTVAGPIVPCGFLGTTSRSRAAEWRLALRQTLGAEISAQSKLKVRSKSDELEAHSDPETAELSRQASAGDASQPL